MANHGRETSQFQSEQWLAGVEHDRGNRIWTFLSCDRASSVTVATIVQFILSYAVETPCPLLLRTFGPNCMLSCLGVYALGQDLAHKEARHSDEGLRMQVARLPLASEQNTGQAAAETDFLVHSGVLQAQISGTRIHLSLAPADGREEQVAIRLVGAREDAEPNPGDRLPGESNYLIGKDITAWHLHVPQYGRVGYPEVYRGIDLAYYGNGTSMEHDFVVHPGRVLLRFT